MERWVKSEKIIHPGDVASWLGQRTKAGPVAVVTGTYDILQPGNLRVLEEARMAAATVLVVLETDEQAAGHSSPGRPRNELVSRIELAACLRPVDAVTWGGRDLPERCFSGVQGLRWVIGASQRAGDVLGPRLEAAGEAVIEVEPLEGCFTEDIGRAIRENRTPVPVPGAVLRAEETGIVRPQAGRRVTVNGCFDILHVGHLRFLARARSLGDSLTVLMNDDGSVARYKGPTRPVFPQAFRRAALLSLAMVDAVIPFSGDTPLDELAELRPDVHVKGGSFEAERVRQERELVESWGGCLEATPLEEGFSTSNYIRSVMGRIP